MFIFNNKWCIIIFHQAILIICEIKKAKLTALLEKK
jgi:cytochrome c biogenesis protein ResB